MKIGVMVPLTKDINSEFNKIKAMDIHSCQLYCWDETLLTDEIAELVNKAAKQWEVGISAFWCGWPGPCVWDFYQGPGTLGIVPVAYRFRRLETLAKGSSFTKHIGVKDMITHAGFIPENPNDPEYAVVIQAIQYIADFCQANEHYFLFETGQETPVTLKRAIQDAGRSNLGINFDPANLLMYGKANPLDAVEILGEWIRGVHAKDGDYPIDGRHLGEEKPLGQGKVNFPLLLDKLKKLSYEGAITIEREISGDQQIRDIQMAKQMIEGWIYR